MRELADDLTHPTAQALFDRLRLAFPTMSFATVYNTLAALTECSLVQGLNLGGSVRHDPNTEPHHHAVCDACGVIHDIPLERVERVERAAVGRLDLVSRLSRAAGAAHLPRPLRAVHRITGLVTVTRRAP